MFLLNNDSLGVHFNNSTKAVHLTAGDSYMCVKKKKTSTGEVRETTADYDRSEERRDLQ